MKQDITQYGDDELFLTVSNGKAYEQIYFSSIEVYRKLKNVRVGVAYNQSLYLLLSMCEQCFIFTSEQWTYLVNQIKIQA